MDLLFSFQMETEIEETINSTLCQIRNTAFTDYTNIFSGKEDSALSISVFYM